MAFFLLLAFIATPILEIAVLLKVGGLIGLMPTLVLVVLTAVIGTALLRAQGLSTLNRARESLNRGEAPVRAVFDGACLLVGGALLLTPGFVTDTLGFLLLVPPVRAALLRSLTRSRSFQVRAAGFGAPPQGETWPGPGAPPRGPSGAGARGPGVVIDGDFEEVSPETVGPARPTRWGGAERAPEDTTEDTADDAPKGGPGPGGPTPPRAG
ncbi:FxsA family protein [Roseospira visakhapatnamensis]|uniref:UPF0716 protein FxsA n=1 Tax=Roseospira visakhapatnamensis TaxID=390880 RepID=A0A7W6W8U1_9PROT|nr:FxsA family protein [Roseospira visakhapatnamensis]MBB4265173.1 UPF0716 protein FxsA [Roseospira visakhapatnamensis]